MNSFTLARSRALAAGITALALTAAGLVATAPAVAAPVDAQATDLVWDFKTSWVNYIKYQFGGSITASNGASYTANGSAATDLTAWTADAVSYDPLDGSGSADFLGDVEYLLPAHGIDLTLSAPELSWGETGDAELSLSVNGGTRFTLATADLEFGDVTVDGDAATVEVTGSNVLMTDEGATFDVGGGSTLGGYGYTAGTALSGFNFDLEYPLAAVTVATPTTSPAAGPQLLGTSVTVSTSVTSGDPATGVERGSVEFFAIPAAGGDEISLGADTTLVDGSASIETDALPGGGYRFRAAYSDGTVYADGSASQLSTANFGVVDTSTPALCDATDGVVSTTPASAEWSLPYFNGFGPTRTASGDITVDGSGVYSFTGGIVTADADCASIAFDGDFGVILHGGLVEIEFIDPVLTIDADGEGSLRARTHVYANQGGIVDITTDEPVTILTISSVTGLPTSGASGEATVSFDYAGTTAVGTWSRLYGNGWANEFLWAIPAAARAYFHDSSSASATKPAVPMSVDFAWPLVPADTLPARIAGDDRYATSAALVGQFAKLYGSDVVFVATGENYPDALAAAAAAAKLGAPVILTKKKELPAVVKAQLNALQPQTIYVLGSSAAISGSVVNALKTVTGGPTVLRLAGDDRYATAREIVKTAFGVDGDGDAAEGIQLDTVVIATGRNFPDALSAGAAVASVGGAVVLVDGATSSVPSATMKLIADLDPDRIVIAGGTPAIPSTIQKQLAAAFPGIVTRKAGDDRFATSIELNKFFYSDADIAFFATGRNFPDALSAAPLAGLLGAPLLVTERSCIEPAGKSYVQSLAPEKIVLLGSSTVLSGSLYSLKTC